MVLDTAKPEGAMTGERFIKSLQDGREVFIDGKKVWAYHVGSTEKKVEVGAGEHHVELKDFMEDETLCRGQLYVDRDLVIGISQRGCLEVYSAPGAFSRR